MEDPDVASATTGGAETANGPLRHVAAGLRLQFRQMRPRVVDASVLKKLNPKRMKQLTYVKVKRGQFV